MKQRQPVATNTEPLTLTVAEYAKLRGSGEHSVREDLRAGKIPHIKCGRRGLLRILRRPALAQLGVTLDSEGEGAQAL